MFTTQTPETSQIVSEAREIVSRPDLYHERPSLRLLAWSTLMHARGNHVDQLQLARMQRQTRLPLAARLLSRPTTDVPVPPTGGRAA